MPTSSRRYFSWRALGTPPAALPKLWQKCFHACLHACRHAWKPSWQRFRSAAWEPPRAPVALHESVRRSARTDF
eukprot:9176898-Pyramimonas_sp.AAC.1